MSNRDEAIKILAHYIRTAIGDKAPGELEAEIGACVDYIIDAAVDAMKERERVIRRAENA